MAVLAGFIVLTLLAAHLEIVENAEVSVSSQAQMQAVKMVKIRQHSDLIRQNRGDDTPSTEAAASTEANSSVPAYEFALADGCPSAGYRPLTAWECGNSTGEVVEGRNATYSTNAPCDAHCVDTASSVSCNAAHWPQGCYMDKDDKTHYNPCKTRVKSGVTGRVDRNYTTDVGESNAKHGVCTDQAWPCVEGGGWECKTCLTDQNARTHENHCTSCNEDSGFYLIGSRCEATTTTTTEFVYESENEASVMNHSHLPEGFFCHNYAVHYEGVTACPVWQAAEACSLPPGMSNSLNGHHTIRAGQDLTLQECAMAALKAQIVRLHYKAAGQALDGTQNFIFKYGRNSNRYMCEAQDSAANFTCTQEACCKVHKKANWGATETPPTPIGGANYTYNYDPAQADQWDLYVLVPLVYTDAAVMWP